MRIITLLFFIFAVIGQVFAELPSAGYYRVLNKATNRYITVIDDKGSIDMATTDADLGAIETTKYFKNVVSNPASIIYFDPEGGGYDLKCQGTSTYNIISYYIHLREATGGSFRAYAQRDAMVKYLCDEAGDAEKGVVLTNTISTSYWYIVPVDSKDNQYFGMEPEYNVGNNYYLTLYASFPFSLPEGMTAYYIDLVDNGMAVYTEIKDKVVPGATPVVIKCASNNVADNKVSILTSSNGSVSGNMLGGVYFKNSNKIHYNQKPNDPGTIRVLGVTSDGSIGFVKSNVDFLPANKAYLVVPQGTPDELKMVSHEEYDAAGVDLIGTDKTIVQCPGAYTMSGVRIGDTLPENAAPGLYIVNGKKIAVTH